MELNNYSRKSKDYEKSLDLVLKKENGIFYTDIGLSQKIIKFLDIPTTATIIDPCCGTGSFLLSAKNMGYSAVYGADIDKNAISFIKKEYNIENVKVINTLVNSGEEVLKKLKIGSECDFVIGNPPYAPISKDIVIDTNDYLFLRNVKDSGSNLFVGALYRAFELAKSNGIISYIIPKNFLHISSYGLLRRTI